MIQDMFTCPRIPGNLQLSKQSCADQFAASQNPSKRFRFSHCCDCHIGRKNSNIEEPLPFQNVHICARCGNSSSRIVLSRLCISCYNREREWRIGKNRRGAMPALFKPVSKFAFIEKDSMQRYIIEASSIVEARISAQKIWGIANLVLDRRSPTKVYQWTIFESPSRPIYAETPISSAKPRQSVGTR